MHSFASDVDLTAKWQKVILHRGVSGSSIQGLDVKSVQRMALFGIQIELECGVPRPLQPECISNLLSSP